MSKILTDIYTIFSFRDILYHDDHEKLRIEDYKEIFHFIEHLILAEEIYVDRDGIEKYEFKHVCEKFNGVIRYLDSSSLYPDKTFYEYNYNRDEMLAQRGLSYLEIARTNKLIFAPHPHRSNLINHQINMEIESVAKTIFSHIENSLSESKPWQCARVNIQIPPIVEHVITFSKQNKLELSESINEIRNCKNARLFREYCTNIYNEMRETGPRKRVAIYQMLFRDIDKLSSKWNEDLNENIQYKSRNLKFTKFFGIEKLLEALGMDNISIKDPVLTAENPYLLFVNDVYN